MKKEAIHRARVIIAEILIVITVVCGGLFLLNRIGYINYEHYQTYTTSDMAYDIVLYKSEPLFFSLDGNVKFKMVCKDNSDGSEVEYAKFDFTPCKGCSISLEEDDGQKCVFGVDDYSRYRKFDLVWSEIFT